MLDAVACNNLIRLDGVAAARDPGGHSGAVMPPAVRRLKTQQITEVPLTRNGRQRMGETPRGTLDRRSEEHTSELQSLMRISYAVFCLKKKTNTDIRHAH